MSAYCDHILSRIIPLCRDRFADARHGGFHEHLDARGSPLPPGAKRLMVQCRQLYVLSQAALLGDPTGQRIAERGYDFLRSHYRDKRQSGWFFRADATGEPIDRSKDLYGHAFVLFALANLHRAFAAPDALALATATMDTLHTHMTASNGGFWDNAAEDWTPDTALRRQNPHMHLLEAVLALFEASGDRRWLHEADALIALFRDRFFDPATATLGEFFTADWTPHPATGHIVEPGHHFEWVWLLHRYATLSGRPVEPAADALFTMAMQYGVDADNGHIHDQLDRSGAPILRTRRIWTLTEAIKAHTARIEAGLPVAAGHPERLGQHLLDHFLRPAELGWIETMMPDGTPTQTSLPGSTPYHLVMAAAEMQRVLG
jgi:mannose/cellobiose epimerase-like protein (N-acyl-D-glucosamine 2-epimerase family)